LTRDLEKNQKSISKILKNIQKQAIRSIANDYKLTLNLIRAELMKRIEAFGELNNTNLSKFGRREKLMADIIGLINSLNAKRNAKIKRNSYIQTKQSYFRNAWAVDQNIGVGLKWGIKKDSFK